jgi:transposase
MKKEERQVLINKYLSNGLSFDEANYKLRVTIKTLNDMTDKLRKQNKPESYIQERFAREFEKLTR